MPAHIAVVLGRNCLAKTTTPAAAIPTPRQLGTRAQNSVGGTRREPAVHQQVKQTVNGVDVAQQPPQVGYRAAGGGRNRRALVEPQRRPARPGAADDGRQHRDRERIEQPAGAAVDVRRLATSAVLGSSTVVATMMRVTVRGLVVNLLTCLTCPRYRLCQVAPEPAARASAIRDQLNSLRIKRFHRFRMLAGDDTAALGPAERAAPRRSRGNAHRGGVTQSDHLSAAKRYCLGLA